jgi:myxalamid-type polyketide synthase MxaE and MxaD
MPDARRSLIGNDLLTSIPGHGLTAGYIDDADAFDAPFFGIGGAEAEGMDPQHRLLLELSWQALADAGLPADNLEGSRTGVFVGLSTSDYALLRMRLADRHRVDTYFGTSNSPSVAAGRIAYQFGFQGPAVAIDTACSSSLMAVHLACQSLRRGESDLALAAGVNLILAPETMIWACQARILSEDGRCHTFDREANGYVRGEGGGVVVLKRLADAERDADAIVAVIRGTAANHDGRSSGLTAPNGTAQQKVIGAALEDAGVSPLEVQYVEAHGTGTTLGDPIEVRALGGSLCRDRAEDRPLVVGSVKTNIGHLEAAAGVAGLIKAALAVRAGRVPPHLHLREVNPYIAAERLPVRFPTRVEDWPGDGRRVAGVSSFGLSGTNVHVVVESPQKLPEMPLDAMDDPRTRVLPLSAHSDTALRRRAADLADWLDRETAPLEALCQTLARRAVHHRRRLAVWGETHAELSQALGAWLDGQPHDRLAVTDAPVTGQGPAAALAGRYVGGGEPVDWAIVHPGSRPPVPLPVYPFDRHRYWMPERPAARTASPEDNTPALAAALDAAAPEARDALLVSHLREGLARAVQQPADTIAVDAPLATLGHDSLMAIDLTNRLATELDVRVPPADLLEKMTLGDLATLVLDLRAAREIGSSGDAAGGNASEELIL